jgi:hypothetical protein
MRFPAAPGDLRAVTRRYLPDIALVLWAAVWAALAVAVFHEVRGLRDVSNTLVQTGHAVDRTGRALEALGDVPIFGERIRGYATEVRQAGRSAERSGRSSKDHIESLAVLLAVVIGLVPTVPVFALYIPLRRAWRRGLLKREAGVP